MRLLSEFKLVFEEADEVQDLKVIIKDLVKNLNIVDSCRNTNLPIIASNEVADESEGTD